jgi:hypothetical protein
MSKEIIIPTDHIMYKGRYCVAGARLTYTWDPKTGTSPREIFDFLTNERSVVMDEDGIRLATTEERFENEEKYFKKRVMS